MFDEIASVIGWMVVYGFVFVMLNFVMKLIHKKFISKLSPDKKKFVDLYRNIMKFVIKYHKPVGILISLMIIVHLILMSVFVYVSVNGLVALALMLLIFGLGLYGAYYKKNYKGLWLKLHRSLAFALILAMFIHVM